MKKLTELNSHRVTYWIVLAEVLVVAVVVGFFVLKSPTKAPTKTSVSSSADHRSATEPAAAAPTQPVTPSPYNPNVSLTQAPVIYPNWTGYGISGQTGTFTMAEADVTVPHISCPSTTQQSQFSLWVGLDGFSGDNTVEQDGIRANCDEQANGAIQPDYYTWEEMYPAALTRASVPIQPGDVVHMEVSYNATTGQYTLALHNQTLGNAADASLVQYAACSSGSVCDRSSAEWISENHIADEDRLISNFGQATFSNAEASTSPDLSALPFTDWKNYPMNATINNVPLETVTDPLNETTSSFTITQLRTS
jgi:hypothetical protein